MPPWDLSKVPGAGLTVVLAGEAMALGVGLGRWSLPAQLLGPGVIRRLFESKCPFSERRPSLSGFSLGYGNSNGWVPEAAGLQ